MREKAQLHGKSKRTDTIVITDSDKEKKAEKPNTRSARGSKRKVSTDNDMETKAKKPSTTCAAQITEQIPCHMCNTFYAIISEKLAKHFQQVHLEHFVMERKTPVSQCKKKLNAKCFKTLLRKGKVVEVKVAGSEYILSSVIVALGEMGIRKVDSVLCTDIPNEEKVLKPLKVLQMTKSRH